MRRYRGSSGAERKADRRAQLIDAAIAVYGQAGHDHAGVRRICHAAGLSERYFYESFANGDELLVAAFDHAARAFEYELLLLGETADRRALLETYFGALRDNPVLSRLFVIEAPAAGSPIVNLFDDAVVRFGRILCGLPRQEELCAARRVLLIGVAGGLFHIGRQWISEQFEAPLDTVVDAAERFCVVLVPGEIDIHA